MQDAATDTGGAYSRLSVASFLCLLLLVLGASLALEIGRMDIVSDNEGQRATPPAEMLRSGDYLIPTLNGEAYLLKPPLFYWAVASVYRLTGVVAPWTARIPSVLAGILLVLCVYAFVRRNGSEGAARWTAVSLFIAPYALERMRLAQLDIALSLMVFLAIWAMNSAQRKNTFSASLFPSLLAGLALGGAFLIKGPAPIPFLGAAWGVHLLLTGGEIGKALRYGLRWSLFALALSLLLYPLAQGLFLWHGPEATTGFLVFLRKFVSMPFGLGIAGAAWAWWVFRSLRGRWMRQISILVGVFGVGLLVLLPWVLAVIQAKGWAYVGGVIQNEFIERTHSATPINSGSPLYYVLALPLILAPWGFLLPIQFSRRLWAQAPYLYRFGALSGGLGVLAFSLVAGKEYEYILPAFPLLLIPIAYFLSDFFSGEKAHWSYRWREVWLKVLPVILLVGGFGLAIYITIEQPFPLLLLEAWIFALAVFLFFVLGKRRPRYRTVCLAGAALLVILSGVLSRAYHYTDESSPKALAQLMGDLRRQGYRVEACRITPAFAFYIGTPIPVVETPETVLGRLGADEPYYYLIRESYVEGFQESAGGISAQALFGPVTKKDYVLWGNRPLPETLKEDVLPGQRRE